jgi:hypothetical protein
MSRLFGAVAAVLRAWWEAIFQRHAPEPPAPRLKNHDDTFISTLGVKEAPKSRKEAVPVPQADAAVSAGIAEIAVNGQDVRSGDLPLVETHEASERVIGQSGVAPNRAENTSEYEPLGAAAIGGETVAVGSRDSSRTGAEITPVTESGVGLNGNDGKTGQTRSVSGDAEGQGAGSAQGHGDVELEHLPKHEQAKEGADESAEVSEQAGLGAVDPAAVEVPVVPRKGVEAARFVRGARKRETRASPGKRKQPRSMLYRPPVGAQSEALKPSREKAENEGSKASTWGRPARIEVRVLLGRGGYCTVSLLPRRPPGMPEQLTVSNGTGENELVALEDEWYQDVVPDNLSQHLREGLVWKDQASGQEWFLSGRTVFVLAPGTALRGYVSCPRLSLDRDQVVLCSNAQLAHVEKVLEEIGCTGWTRREESDGAPAGWVLLQGVVPKRPVPPSNEGDILDVLKPLPGIEVVFEGGVRVVHSSWLVEYPPVILVYGDPEHVEKVLIDGQIAFISGGQGYAAPGWNEEGTHQVWCSNTTKSYSLVRNQKMSRFWPAYSFPLQNDRGGDCRFAFCGPLVRPMYAADGLGSDVQPRARQAIQLPASNPVLLGPKAGQVFVAQRRKDMTGARCIACPPFDPVWALPSQPLLCPKHSSRVFLIGQPVAAVRVDRSASAERNRHEIERWCRMISDAGRKGLAVEPADQATRQLWQEYKRCARSVWRRMR